MDHLLMICSRIIKLRPQTTNLELQKYLYFIQAASLIHLGRPAFPEEIEAWQYGPVVYKAYKEFKYNLEILKATQTQNLEDDIDNLVIEIIDEFKNDSAYDLVERTHSYSSWMEAWKLNKKITNEKIIECHQKISKENDGMIF